ARCNQSMYAVTADLRTNSHSLSNEKQEPPKRDCCEVTGNRKLSRAMRSERLISIEKTSQKKHRTRRRQRDQGAEQMGLGLHLRMQAMQVRMQAMQSAKIYWNFMRSCWNNL